MISRPPVSWSLSFDEPILLANGTPLRTLREAADHVMGPPKTNSALPHWQLAVRCPMSAAEKGGPAMMARDRSGEGAGSRQGGAPTQG